MIRVIRAVPAYLDGGDRLDFLSLLVSRVPREELPLCFSPFNPEALSLGGGDIRFLVVGRAVDEEVEAT